MLRAALSRASAAAAAAPAAASACLLQSRAMAQVPAAPKYETRLQQMIEEFDEKVGAPHRAAMIKHFEDHGIHPIPPEFYEKNRPPYVVMDAFNKAYIPLLGLSEAQQKEAHIMRRQVREAFDRQYEEMMPKPVHIDWEYWKERLDPKTVELYKIALEKTVNSPAFKNPPKRKGPDPLLETCESVKKRMLELHELIKEDERKAKIVAKQIKERRAQIEAEVAELELLDGLGRLKDTLDEDGTPVAPTFESHPGMFIDTKLARNPKMREKIDQEILDDKW